MPNKTDTELRLNQTLDHRQCATVLAALRIFQTLANDAAVLRVTDATKAPSYWESAHGAGIAQHMEHFEDGTKPLTVKELDSLCEAINLQSVVNLGPGAQPVDYKARYKYAKELTPTARAENEWECPKNPKRLLAVEFECAIDLWAYNVETIEEAAAALNASDTTRDRMKVYDLDDPGRVFIACEQITSWIESEE